MLFSSSNLNAPLSHADKTAAVNAILSGFPNLHRLLIIPPDITRANSGAGELTRLIVKRVLESLPAAHIDILPALGTHFPMSAAERREMFADLPDSMFIVHNWRSNLAHLGDVPAAFVSNVSNAKLDFSIPVEINSLIISGSYDLIISIGQVVPHEVAGMANGNKNILVGAGGKDTINKTHFLGAVCNMETILGRADNPVRSVFNYAEDHFLSDLPIVYLQTVIAADKTMRGLFAGTGQAPFRAAARLSQQLNITKLDRPLNKVVVWLDPREFKSTWLGNKAVYRTRMALADGAELIILAPGVVTFGEDPEIDRLIRTHGYRGTPATLTALKKNPDLAASLSAAAHLIHGSSEGRFAITYAPGRLTRAEIESVNFSYAVINTLLKTYNPEALSDGYNDVAGEEIYFISNPALGLWALTSQFEQ